MLVKLIGCIAAIAALGLSAATPAIAAAPPSWGGPAQVGNAGPLPLTDVACPAAGQCTAVADAGREVTFDPAAPAAATPSGLDSGKNQVAVACPSAALCASVDDTFDETTFDPNAPSGAQVTDLPGDYTENVACPSTTQCTVVFEQPTRQGTYVGAEMTFDPNAPGVPTRWVIDNVNGFLSVSCPALNQCTATDRSGNEMTFDPTAPGTPAPVLIGSGLANVACPSTSQCTGILGAQAVTFDPNSPGTPTPVTIDSGSSLQSIACPSTSFCAAVGNGEAVTFDPNALGSATSVTIDSAGDTDYTKALWSVDCSSASQCVAVDHAGNAYRWAAPVVAAPVVTSVRPSSGPTEGGTSVTITGSNFLSGATVSFGSAPSTSVTFVSPTQLTAIAPPGAPGTVAVSVTTPGGTSASSSKDRYTYIPLSISAFTPTSGITGSTATITGTGFASGDTVRFGSLTSPKVTVSSSTQLKAVVPNGATAADISITDARGTVSSSSTPFTPTLSITGVSPGSGAPGTVVTITGIGFNSPVVKFDGVKAKNVTVVSSTTLHATVPATATSGVITVTNQSEPTGTVDSFTSFTVT